MLDFSKYVFPNVIHIVVTSFLVLIIAWMGGVFHRFAEKNICGVMGDNENRGGVFHIFDETP